jgi:YVTN family beta-propeller protein
MKRAFILSTLVAGFLSSAALAEPIIYVAAGSANKVLAIDPKTNKVVNEFDGIDNPHALVATLDGEYVIAGSLNEKKPSIGSNAVPESTIYIIHPAHGHVMSTMPAPGMIHHQAITPDSRYVISTHPTQGGISYADLEGEGGVKTMKTGPGPNYTVITRDGAKAFVSNSGNNSISEIDLKSWSVSRSLKGGAGPEHIVLSKDEENLFAINARAGKVSVIDVKLGDIIKSWDVGKNAHGLDLSEDGKTIFATSKKSGVLVAIDIEDGTRREMSLSPSPYHLETIAGTGKIYVSSSKEPKIWVIDPKAWKVVSEITIQGEGHQMALGSL